MAPERIVRYVPAESNAPPWRSSSFLLYLGTFVALFAAAVMVGELGDEGSAGLVGWSALALAVAFGAALALERTGRPLLAGLLAFASLVLLGLFVAALLDWIGIGPEDTVADLYADFEPALLLTEIVLIVAGIALMRRFRFPLLGLVVAGTFVFAVVDNFDTLLGGYDADNTIRAILAAIAGGVLVAIALVLDRGDRDPYAFWFHVVGGAALGGGFLELTGGGGLGWAFVGLASLAYIATAVVTGRSSWAVLGAIGVIATSTYVIERVLGLGGLIPFFGDFSGRAEVWEVALAYVVVGSLLITIGYLVRTREERETVRRDRPATAPPVSSE